MAAIVTDQFRILNAGNFVDSVNDTTNNSYYVFLGLPNSAAVGFGRTANWDTNTPNPIDSKNYMSFVKDGMCFGKRVVPANTKKLVRRINWERGRNYEMYRHDYSLTNLTPITNSPRLYESNYYVMNSEYKVYICIYNGSTGDLPTGNASLDEPTFTDLEPSKAGTSGDGYLWKYLFTISPNDIIKFDSTDYISLPNDWSTSTNAQIKAVRDNGNSDINENQLKQVYIQSRGFGYKSGLGQEFNIVGDGTGAKVVIDVDDNGRIINAVVSSGGKGYTYGIVDLGTINGSVSTRANLIPIIPPSKGHGYDIYTELGADKVLVYARFDDSSKDFPVDTKFAQIGIIKNPSQYNSTTLFTENQFSALGSIKFLQDTPGTPTIGNVISQTVTGGTARAYVASYDIETRVLKYFQDRTIFLNPNTHDTVDYVGVTTGSLVLNFASSANVVSSVNFSGSVDINFTGITTNPTGNKIISLDSSFTNGLANPEINKKSGEIIYLDNRPEISRNSRQKEDIKIILEF